MNEPISIIPQEEGLLRAMEGFCIDTLTDPKEAAPGAMAALPKVLDILTRRYYVCWQGSRPSDSSRSASTCR